MKTFHCEACGNLVFFENVQCVKCGHALGFLPPTGELSALEAADDGTWRPLAAGSGHQLYRACLNGRDHRVCNWMVPASDSNPFCVSCRLNQTIPDLSVAGNQERWYKLEKAKRRIIYTITKLRLPMASAENNRPALRFSFLGDVPGGPAVITGHENGLITLNIAEADDDERERRRVNLHEPYRTLLGHLRHEVAHYYWDRLLANTVLLGPFRSLFGDETRDYQAALQAYYQHGPPPDWQTRHVSAYASSHPWEDWAETWAHYFHIVDMVETAASFGIALKPRHPAARAMTADPKIALEQDSNFDALLEQWFPLTYALNALNRGMGLHDVYPFVLSSPAIEKLRFIHDVVHATPAPPISESTYFAK